MNIVALIIQLIAGALGGNAAGALMKKLSLGPVWNSVLGIVGGGIGGQVLAALGVGGGSAAPNDLAGVLTSIAGGGVGGGILMAIVALIRSAFGGHRPTPA